jgi:hypothetical protein
MSKQITYNQDKKALYFQNNDINYKIGLTQFNESDFQLHSKYEIMQNFEKNFISIFEKIERLEKKLKNTKRAINYSYDKPSNRGFSFIINLEIKEYELIFGPAIGDYSIALVLEKISFNEINILDQQENDRINLINGGINEINSFAQDIYLKIQKKYKDFNFILKLDNLRFHKPDANTIESF